MQPIGGQHTGNIGCRFIFLAAQLWIAMEMAADFNQAGRERRGNIFDLAQHSEGSKQADQDQVLIIILAGFKCFVRLS